MTNYQYYDFKIHEILKKNSVITYEQLGQKCPWMFGMGSGWLKFVKKAITPEGYNLG